MYITKTLLTAGTTVTLLGMALTGSAFANYDGSHHNNWQGNHNHKTYAVAHVQSDNDYGNYDSWWSARSNTWDGNRNINTDWNDYVSWSEQNNKDWLTTRGKDWEYNDFQNWWNNHMNNGGNTNSENCNH